MQTRKRARKKNTLTRSLEDSKRIIDFKGTTQITDVTLVMKMDILQEIAPKAKAMLRKERRGIMLMLQKIMDQFRRELENISPVMKNMS